MTEKEIVEYLKENRTKGVAFGFMPEEVQLWVRELGHIRQCIRFEAEKWKTLFTTNIWDKCDYSQILALPEDFELEEKSKGEWIECEINKNECFLFNDGHYYHWSEWNTCLTQNHDWLKAFGGWQYPNSKAWFMVPQLAFGDTFSSCQGSQVNEAQPAIPTKIRFWREAR